MKCYSSFSAHGIVWYKLKGRLIGLYEENTKHFKKNGTFCGGGFAGNTITSYNESIQFSINIFDASTSNLYSTEEGALKKMVHPVKVMFTSIKQCELVPATFPAIRMVFASNHISHLILQTSFMSTMATWKSLFAFSAKRRVFRSDE